MSYELYRRSTLGMTLADSLDELIQSDQIPPQLAMRVLQQFDQSMADGLAQRIRARASFKGHLNTYRFCDDVWTFAIDRCTFRIEDETVHADKVVIVACNARRPGDPQ